MAFLPFPLMIQLCLISVRFVCLLGVTAKLFRIVSCNRKVFLSLCFLSLVGRRAQVCVSLGGTLKDTADSWTLFPRRGGSVFSPLKSGWSWLRFRPKEHGFWYVLLVVAGFVIFQEQA